MGDTEYTFKHALTQEVAYNSMLIERRQALHERTRAAIETLYASSIDDHLGRAGASLRPQRQFGQGDASTTRAGRTGDQSLSLRTRRQARLQRRAELDQEMAECGGARRAERWRCNCALAGAWHYEGTRRPAWKRRLLRARELCRAQRRPARGSFNAFNGLCVNYIFQAKLGRALELCEEISKIAAPRRADERLDRARGPVRPVALGGFSAATPSAWSTARNRGRRHARPSQGELRGRPRAASGALILALTRLSPISPERIAHAKALQMRARNPIPIAIVIARVVRDPSIATS